MFWREVRSFHGSSVIHEKVPKLNGWKIIREMVRHIWPRDRPWLKVRVVTAIGLLVGAKVSYLYQVFVSMMRNVFMMVCVLIIRRHV